MLSVLSLIYKKALYLRENNYFLYLTFLATLIILEVIMWIILVFLLSKLLVGCSDKKVVTLTADVDVIEYAGEECPTGGYLINGTPVCHGSNVGVSIEPATFCTSGGSLITFYRDYNSNNIKDLYEPILGFYSVCNGQSVNVAVATPTECPNGGVTINSLPVCNGEPGAGVTVISATPLQCPNGGIVVNGTPVCNGLNGANGIDATGVQVVTLCPADTSIFAEKAILVGGELYAVLYSNQNAHPHHIGLVKLNPGTYMTTTSGTSHIFTYTKNLSSITLSCGSQTATYFF